MQRIKGSSAEQMDFLQDQDKPSGIPRLCPSSILDPPHNVRFAIHPSGHDIKVRMADPALNPATAPAGRLSARCAQVALLVRRFAQERFCIDAGQARHAATIRAMDECAVSAPRLDLLLQAGNGAFLPFDLGESPRPVSLGPRQMAPLHRLGRMYFLRQSLTPSPSASATAKSLENQHSLMTD
jgi:hypothetical protein